ncbi:MAG: type II toxin-antitoxin system PemK/MazF family toxin, partial [Clostridia bacterium]|nr:type II toxin-antitoxin system PemK/MazF family toxin [Clostridia bacterium]
YAERAGLARDSVVLLEQVRTLDKRRLREKMGHLDEEIMLEIDNAIAVSLGLLPHGARLPARPATVAPMPSFGTYTVPPAAVASMENAPAAAARAGDEAEKTGQGGAMG